MQIKNMGEVFGGAYERYMQLIEEFISRDWEIHHISPKGFSNIKHKNLTHHGILDIPLRPGFLPFSIQTLPRMLWFGATTPIDLVVTFSVLEGLLGAMFKSFKKRTKLVISSRGDEVALAETNMKNGIKKTLYTKIIKTVEKYTLRKADLVIFLSDKDRQNAVKRTRCDHVVKTKVIYNSITPRLRKLSRARGVSFSTGNKIIGFVGLIYEEGKGLKYLMKAFGKVKQELPNSKLVVVGDGPGKQWLISLVKSLSLEKDVIFTGFQQNPVQYMKGFDLLVLPSLYEAFGAVILEALYVGTPVIGSRAGGIPEVLKYDELLFEPGNADELASKILNLLQNDGAYRKALELCRKRREAFTFDWRDEMLKAISEITR
ncbi:N-acetyl-alpha-D-glucosaminyl L-malate synthase [subsurface metagenome]